MASVRAIADDVAMLHDGAIQWAGPIKDLADSKDPYLHQFVNGHTQGPIEAVR